MIAAAVMSMLLAAQPAAEPAPSAPAEEVTVVEEVVVEGVRAREAVAAFVAEVSASPGRRGQLARFDRRVCPGTMNIRPEYAQLFNDRIAHLALSVGLRVGEPGCRPNILLIGTSDAAQLVPALVEAHPSVFGSDGQDQVGHMGDRALEAFTTTPRPVRWWHVTASVADPFAIASRIRSGVRNDIQRVILVLDTSRAGTVRLGALADYVAMAALARIDPDADTGDAPSILNLFNTEAGAEAPVGITDWDRDYLRGLYSARRYARDHKWQSRDIVRHMTRTQPEEEAGDPAAD